MNNTQTIYIYNGVGEVPMDVTHVRVDPSVTDIPQRAFDDHRKLEAVELPEGLIRIGDWAFCDCTSLRSINIPSTVEEIGERRINIPPGLNIIGQASFLSCESLTDVTFSEGTLRISQDAFSFCTSLVSITLPSSLKVIGVDAFDRCKLLNEIHMPDSIESVETGAFNNCNIRQIRIPPLITKVDLSIVGDNTSLVSLELPETVERLDDNYSEHYTKLSVRNIALPSECETDEDADDDDEFDLLEAFPDNDAHKNDEITLDALRHRFDELPIHKICYYQTYHDNETTMKSLKRGINPWTSNPPGQLNLTGKQQDCLGMTPLHILACSTKQNVEMYQLLIDKYPETLIMKDKWGDIPLLYAIWLNAPTEVVDLLVESYKTLHEEFEFDWSGMIQVLAKRNVPLSNIKRLVNTQTSSFSDQEYDKQQVVLELASSINATQANLYNPFTSIETFRYLLRLSISDRLASLGISRWRIDLGNSIKTLFMTATSRDRETQAVYDRLDMYELAKEATSILELALWKHQMEESTPSINAKSVGQSNKRARVDTNVGERQQYRVNCGANIVVRNVLPYLLPK